MLLYSRALANVGAGTDPIFVHPVGVRCVQLLLKCGVNHLVTAQDKFGLSALHYAALHDFDDVAEVLSHDVKVSRRCR